ncbi:MAG: hypothetical protein ACOVT5_06730, partial [Armatimonadaceae bacterium]
ATVIWSGPPPRIGRDGGSVVETWQALTGVQMHEEWVDGLPAPGRRVGFEGALAGIEPLQILTDFPVDKVHPVQPAGGVEIVARTSAGVVGTRRGLGAGQVVFLGFRPRDDQSRSLGYESRHWFEMLRALGAHAGDDNPETLSRNTPWYCCAFANGAIGIAPHFRDVEEDWEGGFGRDAAADAEYLAKCPAPSDAILLDEFSIAGKRLSYRGRHAVTFRSDASGRPLAFAGAGCDRVGIDGVETVFADRLVEEIAWAPVDDANRVEGGAGWRVWCTTPCRLALPISCMGDVSVVVQGTIPGTAGETVPSRVCNDSVEVEITDATAGKWLFVTA